MKRFFKKKKEEKIIVIVCLSIILIALGIQLLIYNANHKFDDSKVIGRTEKEIADIYGNDYWDQDYKDYEYIRDNDGIVKTMRYKSAVKTDIFGEYQYDIWYIIDFDKNGVAVNAEYQNVP